MTGPRDLSHPGWLRLHGYRCHATHHQGEIHVPNADTNCLICNNSNLMGKGISFLTCHTGHPGYIIWTGTFSSFGVDEHYVRNVFLNRVGEEVVHCSKRVTKITHSGAFPNIPFSCGPHADHAGPSGDSGRSVRREPSPASGAPEPLLSLPHTGKYNAHTLKSTRTHIHSLKHTCMRTTHTQNHTHTRTRTETQLKG